MNIDNTIAAVVTGGASGLGAVTAEALAALGARVGIFDIDEQAGRKIASEIGGIFVNVDVTADDSVAAGFETVRSKNGQERILVNCAGTAIARKTAFRDRETATIGYHDMQGFERIVAINLLGTFRCCAMSAAGMMHLDPVDGERGVIINTSSIAAEDGQVGQTAYSASKGGIVGMTLPMARDLAREQIRVNTILPGVFATPLVESNPEGVKDSLAAQIPHPSRFGRPTEFASMVIELCRNAYMNGASLRLDAAIRMPPR